MMSANEFKILMATTVTVVECVLYGQQRCSLSKRLLLIHTIKYETTIKKRYAVLILFFVL